MHTGIGQERGGEKDNKDWSQQQKTKDRKETGMTKRKALDLNMHISSTEDHGAAGGEEVAGECERTLTDRWSQHAVSFDG